MKIIIDVEDMGEQEEFLNEFCYAFKTGCMCGEVNEEFVKFKWRIE